MSAGQGPNKSPCAALTATVDGISAKLARRGSPGSLDATAMRLFVLLGVAAALALCAGALGAGHGKRATPAEAALFYMKNRWVDEQVAGG